MLLWFLCFVISSLSSYVYVSYRHLIVDDNRPHDRSAVSFSLFKEGAFSTAPINISLHESGIFAWRTLVSSLKGTSFNNHLSELLDFGSASDLFPRLVLLDSKALFELLSSLKDYCH
jgi:hypothetical protein